MILTKEYKLDSKTIRKLARHEFLHFQKTHFYMVLFTLLAIVGFSIYEFYEKSNWQFLVSWSPMILMLVLWIAVLFLILPVYISRKGAKHFEVEYTYKIDKVFFEKSGDDGSIFKIRLENIINVSIFQNMFVFRSEGNVLHVVPFTIFESESAIEELKNNLSELKIIHI